MKTDNELIAEFMGLKKGRYSVGYRINQTNGKSGTKVWGAEYFKYDSDWRWLMSVVEKINETDTRFGRTDVIIYRMTCHVNDPEQIIIEATGSTMIEATYKAVVEFIKWYNSQPKA